MSMSTVSVNCSISTLKPSFASSRFRRRSFPFISPHSALCFSGWSETMDCGSGGGPRVFPLHRCKTIHLVRHGQGIHNVEGDKNYDAYMKSEYFDAHIFFCTLMGVHPCDKRRSISEYRSLFPAIDFSLIDSNEDTWWKELAARGLKFMNWLGTRKEKEIAIVTHRAFLFHTLCAFGNYSHHLEKKE